MGKGEKAKQTPPNLPLLLQEEHRIFQTRLNSQFKEVIYFTYNNDIGKTETTPSQKEKRTQHRNSRIPQNRPSSLAKGQAPPTPSPRRPGTASSALNLKRMSQSRRRTTNRNERLNPTADPWQVVHAHPDQPGHYCTNC